MSYIRPLENSACLYIYPETGGVRFMSFPEHTDEIIPDEMLDILLALMSDEELNKRIGHGIVLLDILNNEDYEKYKELKNFY